MSRTVNLPRLDSYGARTAASPSVRVLTWPVPGGWGLLAVPVGAEGPAVFLRWPGHHDAQPYLRRNLLARYRTAADAACAAWDLLAV
jgi:hypothetical protein